MSLDNTHYVLIGVLALMFLPKFLGTWEDRQYNANQALEAKVDANSSKILSMEAQFLSFKSTLEQVLENTEKFNRTVFESETIARELTQFKQEIAEENLRQWSRINNNEEKHDKLEARFTDLISRTDD